MGGGTWGRVRLWEGGHGGGLGCVEEDTYVEFDSIRAIIPLKILTSMYILGLLKYVDSKAF